MISVASDAFGLPRDPEHAIHIAVGDWEFRRVRRSDEYIELRSQGFELHHIAADGVYLRKTCWQRCGCGLEYGHDPDLIWVL